MNTWKSLVLGVVLGLLISGAILLIALPPHGQPLTLTNPPTPSSLTVYITGAINHPGVYTLPYLSRVNDVVQAAGGFSLSADQAAINLASLLEDGAEIIVPSLADSMAATEQAVNGKKPIQPTLVVNYPININTASLSLLQELPGIGATKAQAIITYRQEHGPFSQIEDILNVPGIGSGLFSQMEDLITVLETP
jgi:competence protein ComEA